MKVLVLSVVIFGAAAGTAAAQQPPHTTPVAPATSVFSKTSIERAVAGAITTTPDRRAAPTAAPAPRKTSKNFLKTPWPYIIAAGVTAGVLIAVYSGGNGSGTGPY
jgi:hypothetical protein